MSINFIINLQLYKDSIIGAYTLFRDSIRQRRKSNIMNTKKKVYRVRTQYIFEGVFEVVAESREEARQKVIQDCGMVMGGNIHSTLPD